MSDVIKSPGLGNAYVVGKESGTLKQAAIVTRTDSVPALATDVLFGIKATGIQGSLSIPTANTAVEVKIGAGRLTGRRTVTIQPNQKDTYWGYTNAVTSTTGTKLFKDQFTVFTLQNDAVTIFIVCSTSSASARLTEAT